MRGGLCRTCLKILSAFLSHGKGFAQAGCDLADLRGGARVELEEQGAEVIDRKIAGCQEGIQPVALGAETGPTRLV